MTRQSLIYFLKKLGKKPAFRVLMSICLLALLMTKLSISDLWNTIRQIPIVLWLSILIAFIMGHFLGVLKWNLFINSGQKKLPFSTTFRCYFAGLFANLFLPSVAGGDVVRAGLAIRFNGEKEAVVVGSVLDRFLDISSLGLIILIGAFFSRTSFEERDRLILFSLFILIMIVVVGTLLFVIIPIPNIFPKKIIEFIERLRGNIKRLLSNPKRAFLGFLLAMCIQGSFVVLNAVLGGACNIDLPLYIWFLAWPIAKLSAMLPISLGGIGIREMTLAAFLDRFGVPLSRSVGLGLLWETIIVAGGGIGGIFYFLAKKSAPNSNTFLPKTENVPGKVIN